MSTPYIGSRISFISKLEIRYEGILYNVDPQKSTIALAKVRFFGTEDRPTEHPVTPRNEVYEYIIFRASDIKELVLCETPQPVLSLYSNLPYDPAIVAMSKEPTVPASNMSATASYTGDASSDGISVLAAFGDLFSAKDQASSGSATCSRSPTHFQRVVCPTTHDVLHTAPGYGTQAAARGGGAVQHQQHFSRIDDLQVIFDGLQDSLKNIQKNMNSKFTSQNNRLAEAIPSFARESLTPSAWYAGHDVSRANSSIASGYKVMAIRLLNGRVKENGVTRCRRKCTTDESLRPISQQSHIGSSSSWPRPQIYEFRAIQAPVEWAQRKDVIFLTITIDECRTPNVDFTEDRLCFKGYGGLDQREYECTIEFFSQIDPVKVRRIPSARDVQFVIAKKEAGPFWPRLLKSEKKVHWCKVDFDKWKDEDDLSDDDGANFDVSLRSSICIHRAAKLQMMGQMGGFNAGKLGLDDLEDSKKKDHPNVEDGEDERKAKAAEVGNKAGDAPAEKSGGDSGDKATEMPTSS